MPIANRSYVQDDNRCFGAIFFPGETYSFYMNFPKPISDPDFANFRLDLRDMTTGNTVQTALGLLRKDPYPGGFYKIWCGFVFPVVKFGWYRLVIYDPVNDVTKCVSNPIQVEEFATAKNVARVFYRHRHNKFGYNYEALPDFYNLFTLPLIQTGYQIENDRAQYRNVTNGRLRNLNGFKDEVIKIESYYFDEENHRSMSAVYDHDMIFINKSFVTPKDVYTITQNPRSVLSKGEINVVVDRLFVNPYAYLIQDGSIYDKTEYADEYE